jgi:hypothetical protein
MKGIYLTEEGKKEIESKIAELEQLSKIETFHASLLVETEIQKYKEILSSATILPVEKNWDGVFNKTFSQHFIQEDYPNGVIIKSKK